MQSRPWTMGELRRSELLENLKTYCSSKINSAEVQPSDRSCRTCWLQVSRDIYHRITSLVKSTWIYWDSYQIFPCYPVLYIRNNSKWYNLWMAVIWQEKGERLCNSKLSFSHVCCLLSTLSALKVKIPHTSFLLEGEISMTDKTQTICIDG